MFLGKCLWEQHPSESERKIGQKKERKFKAAAEEASAQVSSEGGCRSETAGTAARGGMPQSFARLGDTRPCPLQVPCRALADCGEPAGCLSGYLQGLMLSL